MIQFHSHLRCLLEDLYLDQLFSFQFKYQIQSDHNMNTDLKVRIPTNIVYFLSWIMSPQKSKVSQNISILPWEDSHLDNLNKPNKITEF